MPNWYILWNLTHDDGDWRPYFLDPLVQEDQDKLHIAVIGLKQKLEDHPVIQCLALFVCYNITLVVT